MYIDKYFLVHSVCVCVYNMVIYFILYSLYIVFRFYHGIIGPNTRAQDMVRMQKQKNKFILLIMIIIILKYGIELKPTTTKIQEMNKFYIRYLIK
jgi:hypothetical protein